MCLYKQNLYDWYIWTTGSGSFYVDIEGLVEDCTVDVENFLVNNGRLT